MGTRPTDWHVLDLDDDPTPGDPERVKQLARELHDFADDVADALRQIKGMAGEDALLRWAGKTAKAFQDEFEEVPKNLKKLQRSYDLAGDALAAYWPKLERAQSLADKALAKGREARNDLTAASGRLDSANSWVERATEKTEKYDEAEGKEKPDDSEVRAAARNATDAKSAQSSAQRAVDNAQGGLEAAKKMAADAKKMREDAASEAKDKLEDAPTRASRTASGGRRRSTGSRTTGTPSSASAR
ncbi:putative T7SS-secreted protein [Streptomyces sp. MAR4 CNX-425]|uniref:WXG100 family type VII secretion target n=1 Tax=Streptomyces sp. MAR4 CNX-425 TaxID=3406343 RepID=UPI003B501C9F